MSVMEGSVRVRIERRKANTGSLVSSLGHDMREERWSDLVLYSSEGIPVAAHRAVLCQLPNLRPLLTSLSGCQAWFSTAEVED